MTDAGITPTLRLEVAMVCFGCGHVNREDARFCDACGAALVSTFGAPAAPGTGDAPIQPLSDLFVGREEEIATLTGALESALQGRGRLVTLVGEPGIGKTRTARQLAAAATAREASVLWGRCYEEGGAPPFWIWVQSIRTYARATDPDDLRRDLGVGAPDIAEVVPDIHGVLPDLEPPPGLEPDQARFRFFDSVAAFLKRASARRPLVFVLDNLHWADRPSLLLLEFLAAELATSRLLVVGTYRDSELSRRHPLAQSLSELGKEQLYQPILLRGLSSRDVNTFLAARTGTAPPRSVVDAVWRQTEGNPLFLTELVRLLEQDAVLAPERLRGEAFVLPVRIPDGVREVIGRRLDRLPHDCNRVLRVASVIGREFSVDLLQRLIPDLQQGPIRDAVEAALAPGLVEVVAGAPLRYRFTHILFQQTLSLELTTGERTVLHGQIADELEQVYGDEVDLHAAELAHHLGEAGAFDVGRLRTYCRLAGEQALRLHGYEQAVIHFERALAGKNAGCVDEETAAILFGLGRAQAAAFPLARMHEAVATLQRASDYYIAAGDVEKAVEVALLPYYPVVGQPTGQTKLLVRTLSLVPSGSKETARLLCRYGRLLALEEGDVAAARSALQRALALAEQSDDRALEFRVLADAANANQFDTASVEWLDKVARALEFAADLRDPQAELVARYSAVNCSFQFGDTSGVARLGSPMLGLAEGLRDRFWLATAHRARAYVHWLRGDYPAARAESDLSLGVAPEESRDLVIRIQIEYEAGNFSQGKRYLERLIGLMEAGPPAANMDCMFTALVIPLVSRLEGSIERLPLAERAAHLGLTKWSGTNTGRYAHVGRAVTAILKNDRIRALDSYKAIADDQHPLLVFSTTCRERLLALLANTFGDDVQARQHFEDALLFCEPRQLWPELAWTTYDFAESLSSSARPDDRARSAELLIQTLALSRQLGMRPLHERALALARRVSTRGPARLAYPDGLTERELEVIRLLAAGKTDRVIADDLSISARTVSNHVSRILSKTSTANRTEAATYALRHGLV